MHFNTLTHVMSDCVNRVSTTNLVSIDLRLLTLDTELELLLKKNSFYSVFHSSSGRSSCYVYYVVVVVLPTYCLPAAVNLSIKIRPNTIFNV